LKPYFLVKITNNLSGRNSFFLALAVFWTLLIAVLCLISFNKMPSVGIKSADKYVHSIFHFVFTILWFLGLYQNAPFKKSLLKVTTFSICYGILIEILQGLLTTTRKADVYDVMANTTGAILGVLALYLYSNYFKKKPL